MSRPKQPKLPPLKQWQKPYADQTRIYRLTNRQAGRIYSGDDILGRNGGFFESLLDSFPSEGRYEKTLPPGHYLFVTAKGNDLQMELRQIASFQLRAVNDDLQLRLRAYEKQTGKPIGDPTITIKGKKQSYDTLSQSYHLKSVGKYGVLLKAKRGEEVVFYNAKPVKANYGYNSGGYYLYPSSQHFYMARGYSNKTRGYIATNQPVYRHGDTVSVKAYVAQGKRGKAYKGEAELVVYAMSKGRSPRKMVLRQTMQKHWNGAFTHQFALGDTLQLDRNYEMYVNVGKQPKKRVAYNRFYLEDYQLDETSYQIRAEKEEYNAGESPTFYVQGTDANGLPLFDARVELLAINKFTERVYADTVFIADTLWRHTAKLEPLGETKITLPVEKLLPATLSLRMVARFRNANNELHDTTFTIKADARRSYIAHQIGQQTIDLAFVQNGDTIPSPAYIFGLGKSKREHEQLYLDTLFSRMLQLPASLPINPQLASYEVSCNGQREEVDMAGEPALVQAWQRRTTDSVYFQIENPRALPVKYSLFSNSKLMSQGNVGQTAHTIAIPRNGKKTYSLSYQYLWAGEMVQVELVSPLFNKQLHVSIEQAAEAYPGQEIPVTVKVADYKGRPVPNTDLTALAVNAQFDQSNLPKLPYYGKKRKKRTLSKSLETREQPAKTAVDTLDTRWFGVFNLDRHEYYRFLNPARFFSDSLYLRYDTILGKTAQIAPFVVNAGELQPVYMVYIDGRLVYSHYSYDQTYAFIAKEGKHSVKLRTRNREYTIPHINFKAGQRLTLCFDENAPSPKTKATEMPEHFTAGEMQLLRKSMMQISDFGGVEGYFWQAEGSVFRVSGGNSGRQLIGPFRDRMMMELLVKDVYSTAFLYEGGYSYEIEEHRQKLKEFDLFDGEKQPELRYTPSVRYNDIAVSPDELEFVSFAKRHRELPIRPECSMKVKGKYRLHLQSDSTIVLAHWHRLSTPDDKRCLPYKGVHNGSTRIFDAQPGWYRLRLFTPSGAYFERDSVLVRPNGTFHERIAYPRFVADPDLKKLGEAEDSVKFFEKKYLRININGKEYNDRLLGYGLFGSQSKFPIAPSYGYGEIQGQVVDAGTGEPIPFANVSFEVKGRLMGTQTDFDGFYSIKHIPAGNYDVTASYISYKPKEVRYVLVRSDKITFLDIKLTEQLELIDQVVVVAYKVPVFEADQTSTGGTVTKEEIRSLPTRNLRSIGAKSSAIYQKEEGEGMKVRGSRGETDYYIDGIKVRGGSNLPASAFDADFLAQSGMRSEFADNAYWQPLLLTDQNGEARFTAKLPDDITSWQAHALAMGPKGKSGRGAALTRSYKKLAANLQLPRFLLQGDSAQMVGKTLNYTNEALPVRTSFGQNGRLLSQTAADTLVRHALLQRQTITAPRAGDTLKLSYKMSLSGSGYVDGEEREIPVLPVGDQQTHGIFLVAEGDTSVTFQLKPESDELTVYVQDNPLRALLSDLDRLQDYPYACMEQTSSKIRGLLMEKSIRGQLGEEFGPKKEKMTENGIKRLLNCRNEQGGWGWWQGGKTNYWMTVYVTETLLKVRKAGYELPEAEQLKEQLEVLLYEMDSREGMYALQVLAADSVDLDYAYFLQRFEDARIKALPREASRKPSLDWRMAQISVRQAVGLPYSLDTLLATKRETLFGSVYWGDYCERWYDNSVQMTLRAYKLLENGPDSLAYLLPKIRRYIYEIKKPNGWRNTLESARILETILPALSARSSTELVEAEVQLSGAVTASLGNTPDAVKLPISGGGGELTVKAGGNGVFLTAYQQYWEPTPEPKSDVFAIETHFWQEGGLVAGNRLEAGKAARLEVSLKVDKKCSYMMVEVPIPAGCSYGDKDAGKHRSEVHREYFKHKAVIFFEHLPAGDYKFSIGLQPRYSGSYTLNPARAELMYFPVFYGRNQTRKVEIGE